MKNAVTCILIYVRILHENLFNELIYDYILHGNLFDELKYHNFVFQRVSELF